MYNDKSAYALYLSKKVSGSCGGCEECGDECTESNNCECCPPGLVEVKGTDGKRIACLTPNDAQEYKAAVTPTCDAGYVALYKEGSPPQFLGCVPSSEFSALYETVNPPA